MEIDVRQRDQRSLKRRERALRMQAERERESGQPGTPLNGNASAAAVDSCDEDDDVVLLKRPPAQQPATGPCPPRLPKKVAEKGAVPPATTTTATSGGGGPTTMKEEAAVDDWLKMEPRLTTPDENGDDSAMDIAPPAAEEHEEVEEDSPLLEEDVIDGFAIQAFKTYEDLEYAIKIANNRNEKRLSAITELTSTMSITKLSNGNFLDGAEHTDADVSGNTNNNNNHLTNGDPSGDRHADPEDDMDRGVAGGAAGAVRTAAEDRLRLVSPALPPKIDTGQGRVERDRDRDWATTKVGPNHGVTLVNNNSSASGSATTTTVESGSGEGSKNSGSGGGNRPNHNHHPQQQPIAGNLALNKTNKNHVSHSSMAQDPSTSDDSGRASDRLISSSSGAPRDADSSRDRLSDASSSRCSSGKGYICDSEGDDDKASDGSSSVGVFPPSSSTGSSAAAVTATTSVSTCSNGASATTTTVSTGVVQPSPTAPRKLDFPTTGLPPLSNGPLGLAGSASPVALPPTAAPAPSPAPAALPPPSLPYPPVTVSNGPLAPGATSTSLATSGAPPRPLSNSSGAQPPPNSTNSISNPPPTSNSAASGPPSTESKAKGTPSVNGTAPLSTTASPLKSAAPTVGPVSANGFGPGSPTNGHLPLPPSRLPAGSALHSPGGHYVGPYIHPHTHLPLGHPVLHQYPNLHNHVGVPPSAAAPTASAPIIHPPAPSLDSAAAATARTNSPAVATSAGHSAAASPLVNGTGGLNPVATSTPSGIAPSSFLGGPPLGLPPNSSGSGSVLMGTSTGPPPPPIPTLPYGHRSGGLVPPPVPSLYSNFPLYSPYASLHNPYLSPMAGGPLPPLPLVAPSPSSQPPPVSTVSSPASPSPRHISSSFSINKLTSTTTAASTTTTTSASASALSTNGGSSGSSKSSSSSSNRLVDLKGSSSAGLRPGSPSTHSRDMLPDHLHHLQHFGQHQPVGSVSSQPPRTTAHSPRGHSPNRERESYSSNVSSLSRSSVPPYGAPGAGGSSTAAGPSPLPGSGSLLSGTPPAIGSSLPPSSGAPGLSFPKSTWSSPLPSSATTPVTTPRPTPPPIGPSASGTSALDPLASSGGTTFPATPLFATPLPPPTSSSASSAASTAIQTTSTGPPPPPTAHPFSAEVLFQTNQADLLRRELDNRFLDRSGAAALNPAASFMRQELHHHQHQHQHTHLHQQIMPPTSATPGPLLGPQQSTLFKDMAPKLGESPFYRSALGGMSSYPGYASSLLHPGLSGPTPFMPPSHMAPFTPKQPLPPHSIESKPKTLKTGVWNSMHVRIAWEIYHHQTKQNPDKSIPGLGSSLYSLSSLGPSGTPGGIGGGALPLHGSGASGGGGAPTVAPKPTTDPLLRPPSHLFSHIRPSPFGQPQQLPPAYLAASPYNRFAPFGASPYAVPPFPRDLPGVPSPLSVHDAYSGIPRSYGPFPPTSLAGGAGGPQPPPGWPLKPDPSIDAAAAARREAEEQQQQQREREQREREQRERERQRREREERERERQKEREKEEKLRKEQERERERERERREKERRESERREMERERLLQQQRDSAAKQQHVQRDRSPLRNGLGDPNDIRIKDEPRKEDPTEMLLRAGGDRYHPHAMGVHPYMTAGRQFAPPPHLGRPMMPPSLGPPPPMSHFGPPPPHGHPGWPMLDPYRDPFNPYNQLRFIEAIRADEERAKAMSYAAHAHLRAKEPSPIPPPSSGGPSPHHRSPLSSAGLVVGPPNGKLAPGPPSMNGGLGMDGAVKKDDPMR